MPETPPNVLLFLMDGVQGAALDPGSPCIAPEMDRLRERGVQFERTYTTCPTCSPARASLMTGLLPHNHGVLEVEHGRDPDQVELRRDKPHWAQRLQAAGYQTAYFGKWHIERTNQLEEFGWGVNGCKGAEHHLDLGKGRDVAAEFPIDPELSRYVEGPPGYHRILHYGVTDVPPEQRYPAHTIDQALAFLEQRTASGENSDPWCVCVSFSEPNESLIVSRSTFEQYDVESIPLPPNWNDDLSDRPNIYQRERLISEELTERQWRMARACYFGRMTELDDELARLTRHLEESGELENTVVIVTADHGRYVGAHGFDAHNFGPFEEIYRVPLIMAGPGIAEGARTEGLVSLADLCPTILELTGAEPIEPIDARSFAPLLSAPGETAEFHTAYAEYFGTRFRLTQRIYWEGNWKFVFNGFDFDELYNLETDPHEMENLAHRPEHRERVERMMSRIWSEIHRTGDRTLAETHYYSMRLGAVGPGMCE
jgi:arylsulfatase A-like enzyme